MLQRILGGLIVLALVGPAIADEVRGRIVTVDLGRKELVVHHGGRARGVDYRFVLDDQTQVLFGGEPGKLADLPTGRVARVSYEDRDGKPVARTIRVPLPLRGLTEAKTPPAVPGRPTGDAVTGTLQRIALTDREIVVLGPGSKGPQTETTIGVPEGAAISRDGKKIGLDGLQEGDAVTVMVERKEGQLTARSVQVGKTPPAAAAMQKDDVLPRVRQVLRIIDQILQQIEKRPPQ
jgi:hypothetical protein